MKTLLPAVLVAAAFLSACSPAVPDQAQQTQQQQTQQSQIQQQKVPRLYDGQKDLVTVGAPETGVAPDGKTWFIRGLIENESKHRYQHVEIFFHVYNSRDERVDTISDRIKDLPAGERWRFVCLRPMTGGKPYARFDRIEAY